MNIYIEKPNEKLYMINVIDLHMLKQNNMHTSNDVFPGSTCPVIKIKVMFNDRIQGSRSPKFGAEIRPHSQSQKVCFFPTNSR